ncbi:GNAT family N-acetyltransferase [Agromyces sp. MMS24-K17]|uniref:GNAT family N-acetyltransferase n=1 Tax=Agromyces sp. MMS24-K17 TaxID=3372850 RepID=UPI0037552AB6
MTDATEASAWLPDDFEHPTRVELAPGYHLRPIRADDVELDYPAVMGSRERLWGIYGDAWGWPPETMTFEADREDLAMHEREIAEHLTFNYAILDDDETRLVGCIYIDPHDEADAESSWWVVDDLVGSEVERALDAFVPGWLRETWGFGKVEFPFNAVS